MTTRSRRLLGLLAALAAFPLTACLLAAATPFFFMALARCWSFHDSCDDGVGWAVLISAPISIPLIAIAAAACATVTYLRITRPTTAP